uniref:Uncharacterized protein n=1 Tax=Sanxia water strider virus 12 TaxID=1923396 RepID=A0A1L3KEW6_9VIRU|nr:hypothetical protein 1 [Sanxia water strider virus 12]
MLSEENLKVYGTVPIHLIQPGPPVKLFSGLKQKMVLRGMLVLGDLEIILSRLHMLYPILTIGYLFRRVTQALFAVIIRLFTIMMRLRFLKYLLVFLLLYKLNLLKLVLRTTLWFVSQGVKPLNPPPVEYLLRPQPLEFTSIAEPPKLVIQEPPIWLEIIQSPLCIYLAVTLVIFVSLLATFKWLYNSLLSLLNLRTNLKFMVQLLLRLIRSSLVILRWLKVCVLEIYSWMPSLEVMPLLENLFQRLKGKIRNVGNVRWSKMIGMKKICLKLRKLKHVGLELILRIMSFSWVTIITLLTMLLLLALNMSLVNVMLRFIWATLLLTLRSVKLLLYVMMKITFLMMNLF